MCRRGQRCRTTLPLPTDSRYTASGLDRTTVLRIEDLDCSPCHLKKCPLPHHGCMEWTTTEQVLKACRDLLERFPSSGVGPGEE